MDTKEKLNNLISTFNHAAPAYIIVGNIDHLRMYIKDFLKNIFCQAHTCNTCITCIHIQQDIYPKATWIKNYHKQYTIDMISSIFDIVVFALPENQLHFFIIEEADNLSLACANQLLKILEHPPTGYYFFLLTERQGVLYPTIQSRCHSIYFPNKKVVHQHPLLPYFTNVHSDPFAFMETLESLSFTETENAQLLDAILSFWVEETKKIPPLPCIDQIFKIINSAYTVLPVPGSSKLFWKNIFLHMNIIKNQ